MRVVSTCIWLSPRTGRVGSGWDALVPCADLVAVTKSQRVGRVRMVLRGLGLLPSAATDGAHRLLFSDFGH